MRCSTPASWTKCAGARRPISATARKTLGLDEVAALPRDEAIEAIVVRTAAMPPISASGCVACRVSLWSMPIARRARSQMTSSRWHAHGNVYLVAETDEYAMDPGLDGVMQVLEIDGDDVARRDANRYVSTSPRCG